MRNFQLITGYFRQASHSPRHAGDEANAREDPAAESFLSAAAREPPHARITQCDGSETPALLPARRQTPRTPVAAIREACYSGFSDPVNTALATYGLGWHYAAGLQFVRLMLAGHFDRMPRLQMIL